MRIKRICFWLTSLLFSTVGFALNFPLNSQNVNKYYLELCQKEHFFWGNNHVRAFCVNRIYNPHNRPFVFSRDHSPLIWSGHNFPFTSPHVYNRVSILVSGGDLRGYSRKTIANHLTFAAFGEMVYFYADVKKYREHHGFLKPQWLKVELLRNMLRDHYIPEASWIVWVDDDLLFNLNDPQQLNALDAHILRYGTEASMIITSDTYPWGGDYDARFNTGVMIVKKNDTSRKFFSHWWQKKPASETAQENYKPPNQYGLKLLLKEHDYVASGDLVIAPQRTDWGNLNTFHIFDHWETNSPNGLAERGDAAIQHPGVDLKRKQQLIMQTLRVVSDYPSSLSYLLLIRSSCHPGHNFILSRDMLEPYLKDCLKF